ncbi:hypothetical protein VMCG_10715 [Cytospora schulzeri]|uniref:Uncharacterized protein n=1 Tax=Cytospora schulzeri TaxID=448051 RepID=A0A423V9A7_9PEZI|nr:hypothetical protein VMCG_10715 [Valsa malicola]
MAIPETTSTLIAAFQFGIVVNAASAALFLNIRGYGSSIFFDGKRLALIIFLLSAALWAQTDFITILIGPTGPTSCQIGVIFTTVFDQLARYAIEQHLLWVINAGTEVGAGQYVFQGLLAGRFILGAVFVGFSRHQMVTICAPVSSILALAIAVVAVDVGVVAILAARAASVGLFWRLKESGQHSARGRAVAAVLIGLAVWLAASVTMLLGISSIDYIFRSTVPAGGLIILIITVTAGSSVLLDTKPRNRDRNIPEAPSPRPTVTARFITTADSSNYPPSRYEDLKAEQVASITAFVQPREVPLPGQGSLNISKSMGGQGVGGVPIQGQLFPPMRSTDAPPKFAKERPKEKPKTFFRAGKKPERAVTVGGLSISNPVLLEGGSNPLDKVATIDLKTAARQERERRMRTVNRSLSSYRGEATKADSTQTERNKRTTSTVRVEAVSRTPESALSEDAKLAVGSASGAQLSPGGEDIRRRSPRHTPSTSQGSSQSMVVLEPNWIPSPTLKSAGRALPQDQHGVDKTNIPRSLSEPPSPEIPALETDQTPLQRRPTNGFPTDPSGMSVRRPPSGPELQRQETVMFVNDIIYDDPQFVAGVMDDAKEQIPKALVQSQFKTSAPKPPAEADVSPETPGSTVSVVNRPRPVPRRSNTSGMDTYFPPIGVSKGHRKSKSAGALGYRKHILQSNPGSPTTLPPLPPPPQTPTMAARPRPNDTKSMTYNEKMNLLFSQPQGTDGSRRRSSVPALLGTPISSMGNSPTLMANGGHDSRWRTSKEMATLVQKRSFGEGQKSEQAPQGQGYMGVPSQQLSNMTFQGMVNETGGEMMSENWHQETQPSLAIMKNGKRASSPVLPPRMSFRSATTIDDNTTDWGAGTSPVPVQQRGLAVQQAPSERVISAMTNQSGEIGIMLDTSMAHATGPMNPVGMDSPTSEATSTRSSGKWHRRIGEETLRFSSRSRRGTPPVPLVLNDRPMLAKAALAQTTEPSPLPSPEEEFQMIQAQLKKYEQPFRGSVESPGQGRLTLLKDLEKEMGQQETRWAYMQQDLHASRDSFLTLDTSSATESPHTSKNAVAFDTVPEEAEYPSRNSSTRSKASIAAERRAARRARLASLSSTHSTPQDMDHMMSGSRASLWQRRLEEAQMEYLEYANEVSRKRSTNFFSVSKAGLGSPTPPDSDESETENENWRKLAALLEVRDKQQAAEKTAKLLWTPPQAPENRSGPLWVRPEKPYAQHLPCRDPPLPGLSVRPARRTDNITLHIESRQLWQKPTINVGSNACGLWRSPVDLQKLKEAATPAPAAQPPSYYNPGIQRSKTTTGSRPLTQRPPRRSRRITALPDIVEDPQPLPDKRGTLGIFQFPWGERSDVAWVQPRPAMFMAMPGTMSTQPPVISDADRASQLELQEYSSSFFDDYDDEDQSESDYSDYEGSESDDEGFDESTLWEIASLLKSDDVPSRFSMFPQQVNAAGYMVADYLTEEPEQYDDSVTRQSILDSVEEPDGLQEMPSPMPPAKSPKRTQSMLWQATRGTEDAVTRNGKGLPQPEDWHVYAQVLAQPAVIESRTLWTPTLPKMEGSKSLMWAPTRATESPTMELQDISTLSSEPFAPKAMSTRSVWETPLWNFSEQPPRKGEHGVGLPQPQGWKSYEIFRSTVRTKSRPSEPASVESMNLWRAPPEQPGPKNWLQPPRAITISTPLWQVTKQPKKDEHGMGLPQSQDWEKYNINQTTIRAKPRQSQLEAIESVELWQAPGYSAMPGPKNWLLSLRAIATASRLWQVTKNPQRGEHSLGLPQPENWENYDVITTTIRAKPRPSGPAVIESVELWRPQFPEFPAPPSKMWKANMQFVSVARAVSSVRQTSSQSEQPRNMLWSAPSAKLSPVSTGLFDAQAGRSEFRTTSLAPAAVHMERRPRPSERRPLDPLTSMSLWVANNEKMEMNWISVGTSGPITTKRPTAASDMDWEVALQQAIAASYPRYSGYNSQGQLMDPAPRARIEELE